jgi:hypothetical protein
MNLDEHYHGKWIDRGAQFCGIPLELLIVELHKKTYMPNSSSVLKTKII